MMRFLTVTAIVILASMLTTNSLSAEPMSGSKGVDVVFTSDEILSIRAFYESDSRREGRGNAKQKKGPKGLPPGIAKNLARGKVLPPGIAKNALPYELRQALPPVIDGHERIMVGGKILLIEIATQIVRDVLSDVILN